jgi:hypothetical protein
MMTELVRTFEGGQKDGFDFAKLSLSRKGCLRVVMQVIACSRRLNDAERKKLLATEILYGVGDAGVYGMCLYDKWIRDGIQDVVQVSAFCGEAPLEMWITIAHELAQLLAGRGTGHDPEWKAAARKLGLLNPKASGGGCIDDLDPDLVTVLQAIPLPMDGQPFAIWKAAGGPRYERTAARSESERAEASRMAPVRADCACGSANAQSHIVYA